VVLRQGVGNSEGRLSRHFEVIARKGRLESGGCQGYKNAARSFHDFTNRIYFVESYNYEVIPHHLMAPTQVLPPPDNPYFGLTIFTDYLIYNTRSFLSATASGI
jgi:hypothetical protein